MRTIETAEAPLYVVSTRADACELWEWLRPYRARGDYLGWDGETNAVDPFDPSFRLRSAQLSDGQVGWVIQAEREDFGTQMIDVVREVTRSHPRWIAHYADNDMRFAERGAPGAVRLVDRDQQMEPHFYDTQPLLAWFDPRTVTNNDVFVDLNGNRQYRHPVSLPAGLKPTANRTLGTDILTKAESALLERFREIAPKNHRTAKAAKKWGFANIDLDDPVFLEYAGLDAVLEIRLWRVMLAEIQRRGQWPSVYMDLKLQWHIDNMTFRGMVVDLPYAKWLYGELQKVIDQHAAFLAHYGIKDSGSGPAVGKALESLGIVSPKETNKGAASWDAEVLNQIIANAEHARTDGHRTAIELAKAVNLVRKSTKFIAAYVQPMLDAEHRDGRVHCSMRAIGAVTSRQSARDPALQQLPKRTDKRVRAAYVAPEGWLIVSSDLKQGEPRTMAALSGDKNLQADIEAGDINSTLAQVTYGSEFVWAEGKDASKWSYQLRDRGKRGFLSRCYGAAVRKLASILGVGLDRARAIMDSWDGRYFNLAKFADWCNNRKAIVLESGWIIPLWDRYTMDGQGQLRCTDKPSRLGLNAATQGNQAYIMRVAYHRLIEWGWSWALIMLVHDEIVGCVPEHLAETFRQALEAAMTMDFHGFPIRCDATIEGRSWMPQDDFEEAMAGEMADLIREAG